MKNHLKKFIGDAFKAFIGLIVACFLGYFISNGVFGLIASLMSSSKLVVRLFNFIPFFLIVVVALFIVSYREEYRREQFSLSERCISATLACGGQLLFAIIVTYAVYTCGPALSLAQIIYTKNDINVLIDDNEVTSEKVCEIKK